MPRIAYTLPAAELQFTAVRAQGSGGQNVNKVSNAAVLRFDVPASSLPETLKARVLALADSRIGGDGVITIKAQNHASLPRNQDDAVARLVELLDTAAEIPRKRVATKRTYGSQQRRLQGKAVRSAVKAGRGRGGLDE